MNKTLLLTALVSASAFAQEAMPPPPPPPPPQPIAVAPAPADAPMEDPGGRVRWGVSGNLGWHIPTPAFTLGAEGRIGYQVSNMFSAYAVLGGTFGLGFGVSTSVNGASVTATVLSYWYFGALAELMLGNLFYVAGGPILANGVYATALVGASSEGRAQVANVTAAGWKPGIDIRLGLGLGRQHPAPSFRRGGFNIGLDALILFHPNSIITTVTADANGNAGAGVTTNGLTASVVPMLMLGYDGR
jgi:hypothetical protein